MKRIKIIAGVLLILILTVTGIFFFVRIRNVSVEGGRIYSDKEVIASAMSDKYAYHTLYFWIESKIGKIHCLPFIQEIDIEWNSLTDIVLHVYDKTISGCVKYMGQYIYFDKDGVVLQSLSEPMEGVPVVTGVKFGKFTLNEEFQVKDDSLFDTIMNLSRLIRHYKVQVDRIDFEGKKVTLYSGQVSVYLGEKEFYDDELAALSSVLKKTNKKGLSGTINMENFHAGDRIILKTDGNEGSGAVQSAEPAQPQGTQESADVSPGPENSAAAQDVFGTEVPPAEDTAEPATDIEE
ncbi:MAG: hypothetical protein MR965_06305 [Lachnospiraceae bacterium]|nr:hypothetical protein [Lachnospiraceae bacterium]